MMCPSLKDKLGFYTATVIFISGILCMITGYGTQAFIVACLGIITMKVVML